LKQKLQVAVRTLVEHVCRSGDLECGFFGGSRAVEGIRAHQAVQRSRPDTYTPEVRVSHQIETDRFILAVEGRIDGIYREDDRSFDRSFDRISDRVVIDEIKTTFREIAEQDDPIHPIHWAQAKCYAYMYGYTHGLESAAVQLTYYRFDTGEIREVRKHFSIEELKAFFTSLVEPYLSWAEAMIDWYALRDDSLKRLAFPYAGYRTGQREMAVEVYRAVKQGNQLLIQAATGIGKTMAALYPALKALPEGSISKVFYLTARTTGRAVAEKALDELRGKGARLKSLTLTARDKICFDSESACTPEECEYARGHFDRLNGALQEIFLLDAFTREAIVQAARKHRVCPFEFSLELALWADCIVCDYNYAFDPRVFLRRFFMEENNGYLFLIDEAHNLVDRAREMFSAEVWKQPFLDLRRALKKELPDLHRQMGRINAVFVKRRKACEAAGNRMAEKDPPEDLLPMLRRFLISAERWLTKNIKSSFREDLLALFFAAGGFIKISEQYGENYTTCMEKTGEDLKIRLFCTDPAAPLGNALARCRAAVFFSATLTPMAYFKKVFGCDPAARERIYPSPFPPENLFVLLSDRISTRYRHRTETAGAVTRFLFRFVSGKAGNYLLFFPSYEYMNRIHAGFSERYPEVDTLLQATEMTEDERDRFLSWFSADRMKSRAGFVVMGGIFGEGIDLVGERLSGAAIVGVGLPGISLERDLIRDYFDRHLQAGFEFAYLFPGMIRVLQAAGRVIRTENDRGVILLIEQRFATLQYRRLLPENWRPIRVDEGIEFEKTLGRFWGPG